MLVEASIPQDIEWVITIHFLKHSSGPELEIPMVANSCDHYIQSRSSCHPTLQIIKLSKEEFKNTHCYLIWFELKTSGSRAHGFNHCSSRYYGPPSIPRYFCSFSQWVWWKGSVCREFVVFFSWALFFLLPHTSKFLFASSYKQVPFFHQVIYMGNSTSDIISTEINCLK